MNFTITINGEGPELAEALRAVKSALEGQSLSGAVSATVVTPQDNLPGYTAQQPVQQQAFQQLQPHFDQQNQQAQQQVQYGQQPIQQQSYPVQYDQQNQQAQQGYQPQQTQQAQQQPNTGGVPLSTVAYTMDHLSVAATQLMDAGRQPELVALLASFGVPALTMLPKEHFGAFATALRGMGAKI